MFRAAITTLSRRGSRNIATTSGIFNPYLASHGATVESPAIVRASAAASLTPWPGSASTSSWTTALWQRQGKAALSVSSTQLRSAYVPLRKFSASASEESEKPFIATGSENENQQRKEQPIMSKEEIRVSQSV